MIAILLYEGARERDLERDGHERRFKYLVACIKDVNIKGIQIFDLEMMIHVIHTRTKIDLSNMHIHLNLGTCMLFNFLILVIHALELNIKWFQIFEFNLMNLRLWQL